MGIDAGKPNLVNTEAERDFGHSLIQSIVITIGIKVECSR